MMKKLSDGSLQKTPIPTDFLGVQGGAHQEKYFAPPPPKKRFPSMTVV